MKSFRPKGSSGEGPGTGSGDAPLAWQNCEAEVRKTKRLERDGCLDERQGRQPTHRGVGTGRAVLAYSAHASMEELEQRAAAGGEARAVMGTVQREAAPHFSGSVLREGPTLVAEKADGRRGLRRRLEGAGIERTRRSTAREQAWQGAQDPRLRGRREAISQRRKPIEEGSLDADSCGHPQREDAGPAEVRRRSPSSP